jgi:hypothetical protein
LLFKDRATGGRRSAIVPTSGELTADSCDHEPHFCDGLQIHYPSPFLGVNGSKFRKNRKIQKCGSLWHIPSHSFSLEKHGETSEKGWRNIGETFVSPKRLTRPQQVFSATLARFCDFKEHSPLQAVRHAPAAAANPNMK